MLPFQHYRDRLQAQGIYLDFLDEPAESLRRRREGTYASYSFGSGSKRVKVVIKFHSPSVILVLVGCGSDCLDYHFFSFLLF